MVTAILAALLLLVPVGVTTAYLTSRATAGQTAGGLGRWCSVPSGGLAVAIFVAFIFAH